MNTVQIISSAPGHEGELYIYNFDDREFQRVYVIPEEDIPGAIPQDVRDKIEALAALLEGSN